MSPILMTLVFSVVMLMFTAFPAMKLVELLATKIELSQNIQNVLTIITTIFLALCVGIFLNYEKLSSM